MKTQNYNLGKTLLTLLVAGMISLNCNAATKGHESSSLLKGEEKSKAAETNSTTKTEPLAQLMQDWMEKGSYWETPKSNVIENSKLVEEMESWMSNGQYWSDIEKDYQNQDKLTDTLKKWMGKGLYWNSEK
jgi:hypothetical protein